MVAFPPAVPLTNQWTAVFVVPETTALNCFDCFTWRLTLVGEMETATPDAALIETVALPEALFTARLRALTTTAVYDGTFAGAVYQPDEEIVPTVEFPPTIPLTDQLTLLLSVPRTVAVNCCDWFTCKVTVAGEIETDTWRRHLMTTLALAETVGAAALRARTVTEPECTLDGAL